MLLTLILQISQQFCHGYIQVASAMILCAVFVMSLVWVREVQITPEK